MNNVGNEFGMLVYSVRKNKKINAEVLVNGLCSVGVLYNIEGGKVLPGYLLRNALIQRLGLAPEWFECMLTTEEYGEWKLRGRIVNAIERENYEYAWKLLSEYKDKYIKEDLSKIELSYDDVWDADRERDESTACERLRIQYYMRMSCMLAGIDNKIEKYRIAVQMTSMAYDKAGNFSGDRLKLYKLSINELNAYVEGSWGCADAENVICTIKDYIDANYYDRKSKVKIIPKLAVYYCRINESAEDIATLRQMWKRCEEAVELLREEKRAYYMVELLDIQQVVADKLCIHMKGKLQEDCREQMHSLKNERRIWREVLSGEYRRYGLSDMMKNDCYFYHESTAHCINDVIKARRTLYGYSRKQLSDGICAEKTIEKTEQHRTNLQYRNMRMVFEKLGLPCTYQIMFPISGDITDLEKNEQISNHVKNNRLADALAMIEELKGKVAKIDYNIQHFGYHENIVKKWLGQFSTEEVLANITDLLEMTLPFKYIDNFIENKGRGLRKNEPVSKRLYLTEKEVECLISVCSNWNIMKQYEKAERYLELLYEYFILDNEESELNGRIDLLVQIIVIYSSVLGNIGKNEKSSRISDKMSEIKLRQYRPEKLWLDKYNNIWNDNLKEKNIEKYISVLRECISLCEIYNSISMKKLFEEKLKEVL